MSTDGEQGPLASNDNGEGAPAPAVPAAPVAPVRETNEYVISRWMDRIYLDYPHLGNSLAVTMREFVNILATRNTDADNSWLWDNQLDLATVLLALVEKKRRDILIMPAGAATILAGVGLCLTNKEKFKTLDRSMESYNTMTRKDVRWIVIPVTNGMASPQEVERVKAARAEAREAKRNKQAVEQERRVTEEPIPGQYASVIDGEGGDARNKEEEEEEEEMQSRSGTHWGFMVIDKERNDARWLDGHVDVRKKANKHWYIHKMVRQGPAWVAGKILCGYDKVMDLERGGFTAATLKHVPHDTKNNSYGGDEHSACGPWVYSMLKYILDNEKFLTDPGGLYSAFSSRYRRRHSQKMAFNSLQTRRDMQEIICKEADKRLGADDLPYKMSARIVQILGLPSTGQLCDAVASLNPSRRASPGPDGSRSSRKGPDNDDDGSDDGDDGWPDEHEGVSRADYQVYLQEGEPYSRKRLEDAVVAFKQGQTDLQRNFQRGKRGVLTKNPEYKFPQGFSKDNLPAFDQLKMDSEEPWYTTYEDDLLKVDDHRSLALQTSRAVLHSIFKGSFKGENAAVLRDYLKDAHAFTFPERSQNWTSETIAERLDQTYLDLALPLFASFSDASVDIWVKNLHPTAKRVIQDAARVTRYTIARGLLYRLFVGDFTDMTDRDVDKWRANDPQMLEAGKQNREVARWWLTWYYYQGDAMEKLPYLAESPLHWPPREHREAHGQKRKRRSDEVYGGNASNAGQPSSDPDNASNVAQPDPKTIQWATIDHAMLMKHVKKEIREDPRIGELSNDYTYRAILFVRNGGKFKDEKERAVIWIRDINVFTLGHEDQTPKRDIFPTKDGRLVIRPTSEEILERMKEKYEKASSEPASTATGTPQGRQTSSGSQGSPGPTNPPRSSNLPRSPNPPRSSNQPKLHDAEILGDLLEMYPPDFTYPIKARRQEWIKTFPPKMAARIKDMDEWPQKAVLQHLFGGFNAIPPQHRRIWREKHPLLDDNMADDDVAGALRDTVKEFGSEGALKSGILYYPDFYMAWFEKEHEELIETLINAKKDSGDGNGQGQGGRKEYEDLSDDNLESLEDFESDGATTQLIGKAATPGAKRKRAEADAAARAKKRRKGEAPEFRDMAESDLVLWVKELPSGLRKPLLDDIGGKLRDSKAHYTRIYLERIYKKTFQTWAAENPLTTESVKEIRLWRRLGRFDTWDKYSRKNEQGLETFCEEQLFPQTRTIGEGEEAKRVDLPDYSNDKDKWPKEWK
ncbi:hypothetical protein BKA58DRAFT_473300 [Alternaria rosae]|uniref:uncharacterized protein n=1 Tax=Alternaria rosae TaxID=1187941 RepID=UPI001E8E45D4|nr:uncharacterized protein BKA58DRAFT_473300 [Alternaria rosae]KAH6857245.1 hypothetical protein BKA58DRAFT_473300 [Alternaria rosae]